MKSKDIGMLLPPPEMLWTVVNFAQAWNIWAKVLERSIRTGKITVSQLTTLQALYFANRALTPTQISRVLPLETHSVSPLLDRLHKRKLVTRRRSKNDRREVEVEITEQGLDLLRSLGPSIHEAMESVFHKLSEQERDVLVKLARKVSHASADYLGADKRHLDTNARVLSGLAENQNVNIAAGKKAARRKKKAA